MSNLHKYNVEWFGESQSNVEMELTEEEVETFLKVLDLALKSGVPHYDIPSVEFTGK